MAKVIYYRDGRGVVELQGKTTQHIKDSLQTAVALVREEALGQQHWGAEWILGPNTAFTRCLTCGQTAIITKLPLYVVVDSYLHTLCCKPSTLYNPRYVDDTRGNGRTAAHRGYPAAAR